ncbi:MAG: nucleotide disphospho-sugar-binding domain-containing protein [Planctomycetota bacterium]
MNNRIRGILPRSTRRRRILFVGEGVSLAHVGRPLELACALDPAGFEVIFASAEKYRPLAEKAGFEFHPLPTLDSGEFLRRLSRGDALYDRGTIAKYVASERILLARIRPDLAVGDFRVSLPVSAALAGVPCATLCNAHWSPYSALKKFPAPELPVTRILGPALGGWLVKMFAPLAFRLQARGYNTIRREHGLPPVRDIREMYTAGDWTLYPDLPDMAPTRDLPRHHRYLGPVAWSPDVPLPDGWADVRKRGMPIVYVTAGSSGDTDVLGRLLDALATLPVTVALATAGRGSPGVLPPNVFAADYMPGREVLRESALCVMNGGAATGYQAFSEGVPVLALPSNADQFYFAGAAQRAGAGLLLRPSTATPAALTAAAARLLEDPSFRRAALRIRAEIAALPPGDEFARFVKGIFPEYGVPSIHHSIFQVSSSGGVSAIHDPRSTLPDRRMP